MSNPTPPADNPELATGPVQTPPHAETPPQPVHVQESNRLNKAAAWVGVVAGSVIIVAVIFGTGFFVGKEVGEGSRGSHPGYDRGHHMMVRPAMPMFPMGPQGQFERGPGSPGSFGPSGPMTEMPRSPGGSDATPGPARP
ncbi:Uncharacterised protein [Mycolicibacterium vanbaalenii]|uniref:Proline rich protein n=1 Tax=Mycolicibacterium vanbaalenii TaxID=110539 RepID=A0A5S9R760_MYCVN|nr:hypothetical protein [Mycolicibacterium vanbaalenii]CAA0133648.1 Uncharacterised protein [Mycolicibacterium vanbaalenii]